MQVSIVLDPTTIKRQRDGTAKMEELFAEKDTDGNYVAKVTEKVKLTWPEGQALGKYEQTILVRS